MKKLLIIILLIVIAISTTACFSFKLMIEYEPPESGTITQTADNGLYNGIQPAYAIVNGDYVTADGYKWATLDEECIYGTILGLGCNASIDDFKQVPFDWKAEPEEHEEE